MPKRTIPKFEDLVEDFAEHHRRWCEEDYDDQPSYFSIWQQGPDKSLSMPSLANLAVFALTSKRMSVAPDPGGFRAPIDKPHAVNERVEGLIATSGADDQFELALELQQFQEAEFTGPILNDLLAHMSAIFAADLPPLTRAQMRKVLWSVVVSDWRVGAKKVRDLKRALASQPGPIREITLEIFERVIRKLPPLPTGE